jgi:hypothetical protein
MSRVTTPPATPQIKAQQEKIAQRAYEKWVKRGQQHGRDMQDWLEAEAEIRVEMTRAENTPPRR